MILYQGKMLDDSCQNEIINNMKSCLYLPFKSKFSLTSDIVINACSKLSRRVLDGEFDSLVNPYLKSFNINKQQFESMAKLFSGESLLYKCSIELCDKKQTIDDKVIRERYPLGVLLHIAAGNVDVLPAYSVIEGLLSGNVNILKLPAGDSGISVKLLYELIKIEPLLTDYIFVFDVPSTETETIKQLANLSDAIVVWGGDIAVKSVRQFANVDTKIIEWGHKLSFAYATLNATDEQLTELAKSICITNQVLCSSCQGIFIDTNSKEEQIKFAERFFEILKKTNKKVGYADFGMRAKNAINIYNERLEQYQTNNVIYSDNGVSVICTDDSKLTLSYMYRNVWVKRLPKNSIIDNLKPYKNYLQTASVLCNNEEKNDICRILARAGVVRITSPKNMSRTICGEAHDGRYALREYSRIVETEIFD